MDVVPLTRTNKQRATNVFYRAFFNFPLMVYYFPSEQVREHYLEWYLGCIIEHSLRFGEAYTNADVSGLACWFPPDKTSSSLFQYVLSGFLLAPLRFGVKNYKRVIDCEDYTARKHKLYIPRQHYYLWVLVVDPVQQGKGIGTRLLQHGLKRAQQKGLPVYLETHDPKNIPFYQKQGFDVIAEDRVPGHNLTFWTFLREPD